jgi:hypothetical protein
MGALEPTAPRLSDMPREIAHAASVERAITDSVTPIVEAGPQSWSKPTANSPARSHCDQHPATPPDASALPAGPQARAVITRDVVLNPIQFADPDILGNFDFDRELARQARHTFITNHPDQDASGLGTHFASPAVGRIVSDGDIWRFEAVESHQDSPETIKAPR